MATITKPISALERAEREARVGRMLATLRLEGLEPTESAQAVFERYAAGELNLEEMGAEIQAINEREFGPLSLPRD